MNIKIIKITLFAFLFYGLNFFSVWAGSYMGIIPGISSRQDAEDVLGKAIKLTDNGRVCHYSVDGHDLKMLSVIFSQDTVERISLFFNEAYSPKQIKEWLELSSEAVPQYDSRGMMVEYYPEANIEFFYGGSNMSDGVVCLSYVSGLLREAVSFDKNKEEIVEAKDLFDKAQKFFNEKKYPQAVELLRKGLEISPNEFDYRKTLAYCYHETGNWQQAVEELETVVKQAKDYESYRLLGNIFFEHKQYLKAIPYFQKTVAMESAKNGTENLEMLGASYYQTKQINEALDVFVRANKRKSKQPITTYYLAACSDVLGNVVDAKFYYKRYLSLKHENAEMKKIARDRFSILSRVDNKKLKEKNSRAIKHIFKTINDF